MQVKQYTILDNKITFKNNDADLVLVFANRFLLEKKQVLDDIRAAFLNAEIVFCSTAGEIIGLDVLDNSIAITSIKFEKSEVKTALVNITDFENSKTAGKKIASLIPSENLKHIFVIADGQLVNGTPLIDGLILGKESFKSVSGGLAADDGRFEKTIVGLNQTVGEGNIVAIGLYGDNLRIGTASKGGWDSFGPDRLITKSKGNVLYELDNQPALALYKKYLGELSKELPESALRFPLSLADKDGTNPNIVRTILSIDEANESMTFAGDIPQGSYARLMRTNFNRLIDAASEAAEESMAHKKKGEKVDLVVLVSCVGRKLMMGVRIDEEVESVAENFGDTTFIAGFYSYGEIGSFKNGESCSLHNQTMTVTTISEV